MHIIAVELDIKPDKRDAFLAEIRRHVSATRKDEPGCLQFDVSIDQENRNKAIFHEVYASDAALEQHRKSPSLKLYMETTADLLGVRTPHFALRRFVRTGKADVPDPARMPVLFITLKVDPARIDIYLREMEKQADDIQAEEEGCLHFDVSTDKAEPATVYLYEVWASEATLGKHHGGPVQNRFFAATQGMVKDRARRAAFKLL